MLSKKDYVEIAEIIKQELQFSIDKKGHCLNCQNRIIGIAGNLADYFEQDNPKFDHVRFMAACGIN